MDQAQLTDLSSSSEQADVILNIQVGSCCTKDLSHGYINQLFVVITGITKKLGTQM